MREDNASSREAAFLLVTFCCDWHGNTKCLKQTKTNIKTIAISQLMRFLSMYMVINKCVSTFTHKARECHEEDSEMHT